MTVLAFVIGILLMVVGLAVSIALHEVGHLVPAKKFGVRVGQYMIGFGPTLFSRKVGETEYGVKAIPLGGYISMAGMYPPSPKQKARGGKAGGGFFATMVQDARDANDQTLDGDDDRRVFYRLPVYKRIIIMLGGPVMNLLLAIVLFTIVFSGIGIQTATTAIGTVSACVPAASQDAACTPAPAKQAGFEPGDVLVSIDGAPVTSFADAAAVIGASPGRTLQVVVDRDGTHRTLELTPAEVASGGKQPGFAGISSRVDYVRQPIWTGAQAAFGNVGAVAEIIVQLPQKLYGVVQSTVTGGPRDPNSPLSPVGVGVLAGEAASSPAPILDRVSFFLVLLASLNVSLFVFNLVPLLPLDGGHVAVALWDGGKRIWAKLFRRPPPKPVDATRLVPATFVVVVALIAMAAVLIIADLVNPISLAGG